jgi:hypothetical protein
MLRPKRFPRRMATAVQASMFSDEKVIAEFTVEHAGTRWNDWTWAREEYAKLIPLAVHEIAIVELLMTPGDRHLLTAFDFSHVTGDYQIVSRLI